MTRVAKDLPGYRALLEPTSSSSSADCRDWTRKTISRPRPSSTTPFAWQRATEARGHGDARLNLASLSIKFVGFAAARPFHRRTDHGSFPRVRSATAEKWRDQQFAPHERRHAGDGTILGDLLEFGLRLNGRRLAIKVLPVKLPPQPTRIEIVMLKNRTLNPVPKFLHEMRGVTAC